MTSRSRVRAAAVCLAAAGIALLVAPGALAALLGDPTVNGGTQGREYIALGDSYSAGFGLVPFSEEPAAGCFQALANFPHRIADSLGLTLDDRTCSGAVTADIRDVEQVTGAGASAPVQSASLSATTEIVTLSIGGNDLQFSDIAASCIAASSLGPLVADQTTPNCRSKYVVSGGGVEVDTLKDRIDSLVAPALTSTFALITEKAPNAEIVVVGYPAITPDPTNTPVGGCFSPAFTSAGYPENSFPFTDVDTAYLHETEVRLDAAIQTAAEAIGATFISTLEATAAHSACRTTDPYMNGITLEPGEGTPTTPGASLKLGALHPNEAGVAYLAEAVGAELQAIFEPGTPEATAPTPAASATATAQPTAPAPAAPAAPLVIVGVLVLLGAGIGTAILVRRRSAAANRTHKHAPEA
ncbi:SGNH/GDSL hydrolase family protein [Pseudoclavibacter sp. JSM 162008]|uniref:SGNH/GDSL hydrolase family protein n=1 Tax=Pseudoclavibacter sp. JSM 162008 TaxID=3229855 RepID=UPI003525D351